MAWHSLRSEAEIKRILDFIIQRGTDIEVQIPGEEETYFSKVVEALPRPQDGTQELAGNGLQLVLRNLTPGTGNQRIRASHEVVIFFPFRRFLCMFRSKVASISLNPPREGILIGYPVLMEVEEKRKEERLYPESPDFLSAVFTHTDKEQATRTYDLRVLNYSKHGLGLLVKEKAYPLLGQLEAGDSIQEILLFGEALMVRLSAVVRHKSEISDGPYAGSYVIGLESGTSLEEHFDDLSSQTRQH